MANQIADNEGELKDDQKKKKGVFSQFGKYFLTTVILLVQVGGGYLLVTSYYGDIHNWVGGVTSEESAHYSFEDIIINPAKSNGERYLLLSLVVEVNTQNDLELFERQEAKLTDQINQKLSTKTAQQLTEFKQRDSLKQELGVMINETLNKKTVRNLFFTKYVLQ